MATNAEPETFKGWLETAKGGDKYIYAVRSVLDAKTPPEILAVALQARQAFARGEVELVQKRTNGKDSPFQYIAVKKKDKRVPLVGGIPWKVGVCQQPTQDYRSRDWTKG